MSKIIKFLRQGWPKNPELKNDVEENLFKKRLELSVEDNCLLWGFRGVIPKSLQKEVLNQLHASHMEAIKMKQLARNYFLWPYLSEDIEQAIGTCKICLEARPETAKVPLSPWVWPIKPWSRIHTDFLRSFYGHMFLLIIDAHSKWPEIVNMRNNTKATKLIEKFKVILSRFGLPELVVCDNGPQYRSEEFKSFLKRIGIKQTFSQPFYPSTNGAAKNFVKTFKTKVDKIVKEGRSLEDAINFFLLIIEARSTVPRGVHQQC